jgi:hypothetical protein
MQPRKLFLLLGLVSAIAALGATPALAKDRTAPLYAKMKQRFTTAKPRHATGWSFDGALKPFPAGQQVPPQRTTNWVFPRGTRLDLRGVQNCRASDQQLISQGLDACPAGSRVGSGEGSLFLGAAGIVDVKVYVFAARPELAAVFATESGTVLRVLRASVHRRRVSAKIPALQLPGGYEASVTRLALKMPRAGTRKHPLMRTPSKCPRKRRWRFVYLPRYDQPYGVQRSTASVRCRRGH